jgi:hypothetical protein
LLIFKDLTSPLNLLSEKGEETCRRDAKSILEVIQFLMIWFFEQFRWFSRHSMVEA